MNFINKLTISIFLLLFSIRASAQFLDYVKNLNSQKKYKESLNVIEEEIKKNPQNIEAYLAKAETYWYIYNYKIDTSDITINKAFETIQKAYSLNCIFKDFHEIANKWYVIIYRKAVINLNSENYYIATEWFKKVITLIKFLELDDENILYYAGISAFNAENYHFMELCFNQIKKQQRKDIYEMLLIYYNQSNQLSKIINLLRKINSNYTTIDNEIIASSISLLTNNNACEHNNLIYNLANLYENNSLILCLIAQHLYSCNDTISAINILTKSLYKFPNDTLILSQLAILHYNKGIFLLKTAKELINKNSNNVEEYRRLKNMYIEEIKISILYNEKAINNNLKSMQNIICLYDSYKHLQRREEMSKLKAKYVYLK